MPWAGASFGNAHLLQGHHHLQESQAFLFFKFPSVGYHGNFLKREVRRFAWRNVSCWSRLYIHSTGVHILFFKMPSHLCTTYSFSLIRCLADRYIGHVFASALLLLEVCSCRESKLCQIHSSLCPICTSVSQWKNGWTTLSSPNRPGVFFMLVHLVVFCTHNLPCYEYQRAHNMPGSMLHNP